MKRVIAFLIIFACVGAALSAQSMSAGGGLVLDMGFNNGMEFKDRELDPLIMDVTSVFETTSFGIYGFLDIGYVVFDASLTFGTMKMVTEVSALGMSGSGSMDFGDIVSFNIGVMGKYPIDLGSFTLFPLIGINYNMVLSLDGETEDVTEYFSQFGILAGVGADFPINDTMFFRAEGLFQLRFPMKFWEEMVDASKLDPDITNASTTIGLGFQLRVAIGFRL